MTESTLLGSLHVQSNRQTPPLGIEILGKILKQENSAGQHGQIRVEALGSAPEMKHLTALHGIISNERDL